MVDRPDRAAAGRAEIRRAETNSRSARIPRVAVFANSPALRAGLTTLLADDARMTVLSDDDLADGGAPDVIVIESSAGDLIDELIDDQWPQSAVLFVGEPSWDAWSSTERLIGAVSSGIDAARLSAAVLAMSVGLVVIDPELSALLPVAVHREPTDPPDMLTPRERQVLELVARGYPNKTIAYELGISEHTAKFHVGSLLTKLNAASRTEVVTNATRRGLLTV